MFIPTTVTAALQTLALLAEGARAFPDGEHDQVPLVRLGAGRDDAAKRPNIVFILTDDQDVQMQSLDYMPLLKQHLLERGTFYKRHYCTTAICCPARVTLWTGRAAHNTNVTDVSPPHGTVFPNYRSLLVDSRLTT
jgi:hypothetical protein